MIFPIVYNVMYDEKSEVFHEKLLKKAKKLKLVVSYTMKDFAGGDAGQIAVIFKDIQQQSKFDKVIASKFDIQEEDY